GDLGQLSGGIAEEIGEFAMTRYSEEPNGGRSDRDEHPSRDQVSADNPVFVYIRMPGDIDPEDRWANFSDPLQQALEKDRLGEVTGGGTQFSESDENGDDFVEFCGIDVDLYNAAKGLSLLRRELVRLQPPDGTVL